jgi:uncharacterized membrane protein
VAVVSRRALRAPETFDAWIDAFKASVDALPSNDRPACPNCGRFDLEMQYVADSESRIGFCSLWSPFCDHGITIRRVRVPTGADFLSFEEPALVGARIPSFTEIAPVETSLGVAAHLTPLEQQLVHEMLARGGSFKASDLAGHAGISRTTIQRTLRKLMDRGLVERRGRARAIDYQLVDSSGSAVES